MRISETEFAAAQALGDAAQAARAVSARLAPEGDVIVIELNTGAALRVPVASCAQLRNAPREALKRVEITPSGLGLHWPALDADLYVPGLIEDALGR